MRDNMLGRWLVRLAVTIGAGSVALGASAAAAHAGVDAAHASYYTGTFSTVTVQHVSVQHVVDTGTEPVYVTEDWSWD
jgi:hypothetical protein